MTLPRLRRRGGDRDPPLKILQFGSGVFLRGFIDPMVQELIDGGNFEGGIALCKLTPGGSLARFEEQDGCFHHVLRGLRDGAVVDEARAILCIRQWLNPFDEWPRFLGLAREPSLRLVVSNSTEAGIVYQATDRPGECPASFPARLTAFLFERYSHFDGDPERGLIHLPCELIEDNGSTLRALILRHAADWDLGEGFSGWLAESNEFVDTLVDRIVAPPSAEDREALEQRLGVRDELLDASEPYRLLVLRGPRDLVEAELPLGELGSGVVWSDDLDAWRSRKVAVLNGSHTTLVGCGFLSGCETVLECTRHPRVAALLDHVIHREILPGLDGDAAALEDYANDVLERFRNPFLRHRLVDIGLNSLAKIEVRLHPSIRAFHQRTGAAPEGLCFALAALFRFLRSRRGCDEPFEGEHEGRTYLVRDDAERIVHLQRSWTRWDQHGDVQVLVDEILSSEDLWKEPLDDVPGVSSSTAKSLRAILETGTEAALEELFVRLKNERR